MFFPVGLVQKGFQLDANGVPRATQIPIDDLAPAVRLALFDASPSLQKAYTAELAAEAALPPGGELPPSQVVTVPDGNVPLRAFSGNVAFADGDGMETWFSQLNNPAFPALASAVSNFLVWNSGGGTFNPYTNNLVFQNVTLLGEVGVHGNAPNRVVGFSTSPRRDRVQPQRRDRERDV